MTEETLFCEALEISDPGDRSAFLDRACAGDPALRDRLDRLLGRHERVGSFLARPAAALYGSQDTPVGEFSDTPSPAEPDGHTGKLIGPYKLVEVIGEGGMGTVWLAQQQEPVRRLVALKVIRAGMDSRGVLARFEQERQALALMDHPNIAKVLDAGATADGRPYVVMELVKGVPITQFCDERRLGPRERLQLFVPVCEAVQHAHQKGIIHRDLKPSNVLVALYDPGAPGVPKVIDFGVAKAAGPPLTEKTLVTGLGAVVGTLEYMSPEQAELNQLDIDTRSDIYSLGVLLYELLTGTTPLQKQRLKEAALLEILRLVREEDPQRPSTRLSTTEELPSIAANRGVEPRKLSGLVRGELDWIVMKSLEKDRNRRYESASALADDLRRYLTDEPVLAGPPSATYRLRKYARKYRRVLAAVGVFAALLVAGTITSTAFASWAMRERKDADEQKRSAEVNLKRALEAVDKMLTRVGDVQLSHVPHMELVRRDLLLDALRFYQEFLREQGDSPVVRWEAARAYQRVGQIQFLLGHPDESEVALGQAVGLLEKLVEESPNDPAFDDTLAAVHNDLAVLYRSTRRWGQAEAAFQEVVARREQLERDHPLHLQNRRRLAAVQGNLVAHYRQTGDLDKAEAAFKKCTTILEDLLAGDPRDTESRTLLARCHQNVGLVYAAQQRLPEAEGAYKEALVINELLLRDQPDSVEVQRNLGHTYNNLGLLYWRHGQHDKAEAAHKQSLAHKEALLRDYPKVVAFMRDVASSYGNIATVVRKKSPEEALDWAGRAIRILESALERDSRDVDVRMGLFDTLMGRAYAFRRLKQLEDAAKDWRRAIDVSEGQPHVSMRQYRPLILVFLAEHARAAAEIEVLVSERRAQGPDLNLFAEVYSLGSAAAAKDTRIPTAEREKLADQYGARAVEFLRMARAAGYFKNPGNVANLKENKDLDAISSRPDFNELLVELEKK